MVTWVLDSFLKSTLIWFSIDIELDLTAHSDCKLRILRVSFIVTETLMMMLANTVGPDQPAKKPELIRVSSGHKCDKGSFSHILARI